MDQIAEVERKAAIQALTELASTMKEIKTEIAYIRASLSQIQVGVMNVAARR